MDVRLNEILCRRIKDSVHSSIWDDVCDTVMLSGGLDSTIIAAIRKPHYSITIAYGSKVADLMYAECAALKFVRKNLTRILSTQEVLGIIDKIVAALKTFDPITIRNSVVPYAALEVARFNGIKCVYTGDGGDEFFAGYNFLKRYLGDPSRLENEILRLRSIVTFPTFILGENLEVKIIAPFLNEKVVNEAKFIPAPELVDRVWGKMVLRRCFRDEIGDEICWRKKLAQEEGAGITKIKKIIENKFTDFSFVEGTRIAKNKGVNIRDKEHLYYYQCFIRNFSLEEKYDCPELTCSGCGSCISFLSNYCKICGQFPAARPITFEDPKESTG